MQDSDLIQPASQLLPIEHTSIPSRFAAHEMRSENQMFCEQQQQQLQKGEIRLDYLPKHYFKVEANNSIFQS